MPNLRAVSRLLLTGAVGAVLAGCGHTATVGSTRTIRVALSEFRVSPQRIRSPSGELTLVVENDGRLTHSLAVSSHGNIVGQTPPLAPGSRTYLFLTLSPGSYLMSSTLFSDQALGTYGTLTVSR